MEAKDLYELSKKPTFAGRAAKALVDVAPPQGAIRN